MRALATLTALTLCLASAAGLRLSAAPAVGRPLRQIVTRVHAAADEPDSEPLSEAEAREIALAEGEIPLPKPIARSAFAQPDGMVKPGGGTGGKPPPRSRAEEVNTQLATKVTNSLRGLRWSDEPLALTAVKTATWGAIGLAVVFEIYIQLVYAPPPSSGF
jgi:hypothetical protein